jgi:hypothetical protein
MTPPERAGTAEVEAVQPEYPTVGQTVTFTLHAHDPDANEISVTQVCFDSACPPSQVALCCEGEPLRSFVRPVDGPTGPWPPPTPRSEDRTLTCTHVYQAAGDFTPSFVFRSSLGPAPDVPEGHDPYGDTFSTTGRAIHVAPGATDSSTSTTGTSMGLRPPPCT